MRIADLLDLLQGYPKEWEVEMALVAPGTDNDDDDDEIAVDRYSIEGVLPWEAEEEGAPMLWLVGGEDDNVDDFLDWVDEDHEPSNGD
jgi:hypothetical protein